MRNIFTAVIISSAVLTTVPAMACDLLPFGKDMCKAACKVVYKEGIPQQICEYGSSAPHN